MRPSLPARLLLAALAAVVAARMGAAQGQKTPGVEAEASSEGVGGTGLQLYFPASAVYQQQTFASPAELPLHLVKLPPGFHISLYASQPVPAAHSMALSGASNQSVTIVYVGSDETGANGNVHALVDRGSNGTVDEVCRLLANQDTPNGVAWVNGSLFVMETTHLTRYDGVDAAALDGCNISLARSTVILDDFPQQQDHAARYIAVGPDGKLYVGVGAPLNIVQCGAVGRVQQCSIMRMNLDGSELEVFAYGVRNTVGFDWDPRTGALYFGFLERDWQGAANSTSAGYSSDSDNQPDDYLYAAPVGGLHYGYPFCHWVGAGRPELRALGPGYTIPDSTLVPPAAEPLARAVGGVGSALYNASAGLLCEETTPPPLQALGPHVAVLGVKFYSVPGAPGAGASDAHQAGTFPAPFQGGGTILLAEHGSWNRQSAIGYRVAMVQVDPDGRATAHSVFADGWLQGGGAPGAAQSYWGRPAGLLVLPDGSLLVSDDAADAVYRISYGGAAGP